ncbi:hypothetical protein AB1484_32665 [Parafrankia sp. FMc6]|uniref:hypothetical protein n=1 Tax=Parafrankia soli TaxID=2599596 RepID=UPI0034D7054E
MVAIRRQDRVLIARIAAHASWANTTDRTARTTRGRAAFLDRFDRQVDPDGTLAPDERARRAEHARRAYFSALALRSVQARRRRRTRSEQETPPDR